jgi:hypothetical protein
MSDKPTACRIVAEALNRAGESDNGEPWTEAKLAAIWDQYGEFVLATKSCASVSLV